MTILARLRTVFTLGRGVTKGLTKLEAGDDPIALFQSWFDDAKQSGIMLPDAMAVATATPEGTPSVRMMLLKGVSERGFIFYTNYESRKAGELDTNPAAALVLHWPILERQVRIEGTVRRLSENESAAYFATRSRGSQIGAWASDQSATLSDQPELENRVKETQERFANDDIPLPPFWGGYRLMPSRIEFWQGRLNRLHDRLQYTFSSGTWHVRRLYP